MDSVVQPKLVQEASNLEKIKRKWKKIYFFDKNANVLHSEKCLLLENKKDLGKAD